MSSDDVVQALLAHGFSLNEARAYVALLAAGPSTGYEVAQRARIPRSAVYAALRRLVSAGAARSIAGEPERFVAVATDALVALLRDRFDRKVGSLERVLREMDVEPAVPDAFSVHGYERVLEEARRLVDTASERLVVSGWPRELERLAPSFAAAWARGLRPVLFSHALLPDTLAGVHYSYGLGEQALEAFWKHRLVVVADDRRTLVGATEMAASDGAVVSETAAIAELAASQIALDVTLLAQRHEHDASRVIVQIVGDRVGSLDALLAEGSTPLLGRKVRTR